MRILVEEKQAFTVVGDDDQSIYAWRGARPENLMQADRLSRFESDKTRAELSLNKQNPKSGQ